MLLVEYYAEGHPRYGGHRVNLLVLFSRLIYVTLTQPKSICNILLMPSRNLGMPN